MPRPVLWAEKACGASKLVYPPEWAGAREGEHCAARLLYCRGVHVMVFYKALVNLVCLCPVIGIGAGHCWRQAGATLLSTASDWENG